MITPNIPLRIIWQKKPKPPPPLPDFQLLYIYAFSCGRVKLQNAFKVKLLDIKYQKLFYFGEKLAEKIFHKLKKYIDFLRLDFLR
jgi:hypothetical protein